MTQISDTSKRKKDHIDICLNEDVSYNYSNGFDRYRFEHNAITEVEFNSISLESDFLGIRIDYPFIISCMTGGTGEAKAINQGLAEAAVKLNIPIGVGSQRQMLEDEKYIDSFSLFKKTAANIPVLSNLGAAQVSKLKSIDPVLRIMEIVGADAFVVHCNPLQELLQPEGEPDFKGLLKSIERISSQIGKPVIIKEVGSGIGKDAAKSLLDAGTKGIDVAGSGGTSWAAVELLRKQDNGNSHFRNWGMPTSYCVRKVAELKDVYDFTLIASGGIHSFDDVAKSIALGADLGGSARLLLKEYHSAGVEGVVNFVRSMFADVKKVMYLTGCRTIADLHRVNLMKNEEMC